MDSAQVKMAGDIGSDGNYVKGIEDYLPTAQYETEEHKSMVVIILLNRITDSLNERSSECLGLAVLKLPKKQFAELKLCI